MYKYLISILIIILFISCKKDIKNDLNMSNDNNLQLKISASSKIQDGEPDGPPNLIISEYKEYIERNDPIEIKLTITPSGKTPIALTITQLRAIIKSQTQTYSFFFEDNTEANILVNPGKSKTITLKSKDIFSGDFVETPWPDHIPGEYEIWVIYNPTGKGTRSFDYEFLGMAVSNHIKINIK